MNPFLSQISIFAFNFAPRGWAQCDGQILPINQNQSLFSLLGTVYGGDGRTSFALPDLRSRTPIHKGSNNQKSYVLGQKSGAETVTLTTAQIPAHNHLIKTDNNPGASDFQGGVISAEGPFFATPPIPTGNLGHLKSDAFSNTGGNQSHNNMQPTTVLNYCIAMQGVFPSRD